ncbi:MAG TPA: hypothetical protein VGX76_16355, partial [Pirellulales bacterium]|nr:hypothetical protein [Pirellulales bacterium]
MHAHVKGGADLAWDCPSHKLQARKDGADLILGAATKDAASDRDVILVLNSDVPEALATTRFSAMMHDGAQYLMLRHRPDLKISNLQSKIKNPLWLFLFESSGDRDPLLGRAQIEIIRNLLTHADAGDKFLVATAGTRVQFHADAPQTASAANIDAAARFLEQSHLIGALDLASALEHVKKRLPAQGETYLVHVGSGIPAMGERRDAELVKIIAATGKPVRYVGVGVGRRWNRGFMKAAAEKTGGHFTQINPDEPIAWRTFDLFATLATPRLMNIEVQADGGPAFLVFNQSIAQGEEICAVTRISKEMPKSLRIRGLMDGKPVEYKVAVKDVVPRADYLPRTWAKLEIERLLAEDAIKHKDAIVALSKAMYVVTPFTSLLVLEHEDLYTQYKVDRGRKDHWAMYPCPRKIEVVHEPDPAKPADVKNAPTSSSAKPAKNQVIATIIVRLPYQSVARRAVAFSPDGRGLANGSMGLTAKLWDVATRERPVVDFLGGVNPDYVSESEAAVAAGLKWSAVHQAPYLWSLGGFRGDKTNPWHHFNGMLFSAYKPNALFAESLKENSFGDPITDDDLLLFRQGNPVHLYGQIDYDIDERRPPAIGHFVILGNDDNVIRRQMLRVPERLNIFETNQGWGVWPTATVIDDS